MVDDAVLKEQLAHTLEGTNLEGLGERYEGKVRDNYAVGKDRLLKKLIGDHEPPYAEQWRALSEEFAHKMLAGIVAFELQVTDLQCKIKINQHRPEARAAMHALYSQGNDDERSLALWMDKLALSIA